MSRPTIRLVQLPVPQPAALSATGNVPLAAGALGVAARVHGLDSQLDIDVVSPELTDRHGDASLAEVVARGEPEFVGLSLYLWNTERSLHLAREIRRRSPRTRILVGGPEVGADNPFVLAQDGWDVAVTGEAEDTFVSVMRELIAGRDVTGHAGVAVRSNGVSSPFGPAPTAAFPISTYPSPYVAGALPIDPHRAIYIETVRGCRSHCTFCFYPRSSNVLRVLDLPRCGDLLRTLRDGGAREVVFLDPTFNHRPGFDELLDLIIDVNAARSMSFFAEIRAEGLTPEQAGKLARANFTKLEIGLQSVNQETLARTKRGGSAAKVAAAAKMLHESGVRLLVDLIIGLPGDGPDDVSRGIDFLVKHGLGDEAQVFPLAVLPGTAMRTDAAREGLIFDPAPPYRILRTATMDECALRSSLFEAEDRLERRLDEMPRPHLSEADPALDPPDVFRLDLDRLDDADWRVAGRPGSQHSALWLHGRELHRNIGAIRRAIEARLAVDPHCKLDVVLSPTSPFPLDVVDWVREALRAGPGSYLTRALALRGEDGLRRIAVVLESAVKVPRDWGLELMDLVPTFREMSFDAASAMAAELGQTRPGARIVGEVPPIGSTAWDELKTAADADCVTFASRACEAGWVRDVLGH